MFQLLNAIIRTILSAIIRTISRKEENAIDPIASSNKEEYSRVVYEGKEMSLQLYLRSLY